MKTIFFILGCVIKSYTQKYDKNILKLKNRSEIPALTIFVVLLFIKHLLSRLKHHEYGSQIMHVTYNIDTLFRLKA